MSPPSFAKRAGLAALLLAAWLAGPAAAADASAALRCTVTWGATSSVVQTYRLERDAGRVTADGAFLFSTTGATQRGERSTTVRTIETWTDAELILRAEHNTPSGRNLIIRNIIDLKTLATRTTTAMSIAGQPPSPREHQGTCAWVETPPPPGKG